MLLKKTLNISQQHIHCQSCSLSELCLPYSLSSDELVQLDTIIDRKRPIHKTDNLYESGQPLTSLFAIRSGTFKTYTINQQGDEQITGFHLPGDLLGFDAIANQQHPSFAQALETGMVCEIPFQMLDKLSSTLPKLRQQIYKLMSCEINTDQSMLALLNQKTAEQRLATFLIMIGQRYKALSFSENEFRLTMTRGDIGNYLGLTVETISRLLNRLSKQALITVQGKLITINDLEGLKKVTTASKVSLSFIEE